MLDPATAVALTRIDGRELPRLSHSILTGGPAEPVEPEPVEPPADPTAQPEREPGHDAAPASD